MYVTTKPDLQIKVKNIYCSRLPEMVEFSNSANANYSGKIRAIIWRQI